MKQIESGDCFEICLADGRWAYGQVLLWHGQYGHLVQIFDLVERKRNTIDELRMAKSLFAPVFVGLKAALKDNWRVIGNLPVEAFEFPLFRYTHSTQPGKHKNWKLWDGEKYTFVGELSDEHRSLELICVWGYKLLADRIMTGANTRAELLH